MNRLKEVPLARLVGTVFGAIYVVVGLAGFLVTSGIGFAERTGATLIAFDVNPLHNLVHLGIGVALIVAAKAGTSPARVMNTVVGGTYLLVGLAGLVIMDGSLNILALNQADNALHLASAAVLLAAGLHRAGATSLGNSATDDSQEDDTADDPTIRQNAPAPSRRTLTTGDTIERRGVYRCSCGRFAVLLEEGGTLPQCTVGSDHHFTFSGVPKRKATARAS
ncbi:MAG TPA: DUF4383 domain-containing protein [Actinomycetota bacterium]|jgi:uncharacterized membrane protein YuzA (DUF378 family)|nr:DUF4383 domain-containing protein [Actinomycetota bacterium]